MTFCPEVCHFVMTVGADVNHEDHLLVGCLNDPERLLLAGCKLCACEVEARRSRSVMIKTTRLMADYGFNFVFVEARSVELLEKLNKGDGLAKVKSPSFVHQDRPCPGSVCCHGLSPPFVSGGSAPG